MKKVRLIVFAYHHRSGNIASLRFRSLLKYLDKDDFEVFVISSGSAGRVEDEAGVTVLSAGGVGVSKDSKGIDLLTTVMSSVWSGLPFLISSSQSDSWLISSINEASLLVEEAKRRNQKVIVLGTYSPVDALIAAKCVSRKFSVPFVLDFRDGFAFEPLGRKGAIPNIARKTVERLVCKGASQILCATPSINSYYSNNYGCDNTQLLMNGYDPDDRCSISDEDREISENLIAPLLVSKDTLLVGHFGRISQSDSSRLKSFYDFVAKIRTLTDLERDNFCFLFMGELTLEEIEALKSTKSRFLIVPPQNRKVAMASMEHCDALLLVTGSGYGCVSGKIFEYIAARKRVIHFSQVRNDASIILDGLTGSVQSIPCFSDFHFMDLLGDYYEGNEELDEVYSRRVQAKVLDGVLSSLV